MIGLASARSKPVRTGIAILAFWFVIPTTPLPASEPGVDVFDACWRLLERHYYDRSFPDAEHHALRREYRQRAAVTPGGKALRDLLREFLGELGASHATVVHPDVYRVIRSELQNRRTQTYGMLLVQLDGLYFVRRIFEGGPAARAGVRVGDRVVLVDDRSPDRNSRVLDAGYDPALPAPPMFWILPEGRSAVELVIQRTPDPGSRRRLRLSPESMNAVDAAHNSVAIFEHRGVRVGRIHLWYCSRGASAALEAAVEGPLAECHALIVDLRGRGGSPRIAREILAVFQERRGYRLWDRPAVFLVDNRSRSAKEVIAYVVKREQLGPVIGQRTEGAVLGARFYELPDGSWMEIPVTNFTVRDRHLEGVGVIPDVSVQRTIPFCEGYDPILEAGIIVASEQARSADL